MSSFTNECPRYAEHMHGEQWHLRFSHKEMQHWDRIRRNIFWVGFCLLRCATRDDNRLDPIALDGKPDILAEAVMTVIHFITEKER